MNRGLQILKTYINRPIYLLVYLIAFGFCVTLGVNATSPDHPVFVASRISSQPIMSANSQNFPEMQSQDWANRARTLVFETFERDTVPDLSSLPRLTTLEITTQTLSEQDLQRILAVPKLKALRLNASTLADGTLTRLGSKLVELQISSRLLDQHHQELSQLSHLRTPNKTLLTEVL